MSALVRCEECCREIAEEEAAEGEDGRTLCLGCATEEAEEEVAESASATGESCPEGAGTPPAARECEVPHACPEPSKWFEEE